MEAEYLSGDNQMNSFGPEEDQGGGGGLSDFPVLISVAADTDLAAGAQANGNDLLFTSGDGRTKDFPTRSSSTTQAPAR